MSERLLGLIGLEGAATRWYVPLLVVTVVLSAAAGGPTGLGAAIACIAAVGVATRLLVSVEDRGWASTLIATAVVLRVAFAALLHVILVQRSPEGALFLDDAGYTQLAAALADYWHGRGAAPFLDPSLDHTYVRTAAAVFFAVGPSAIALKLLNTFFGVASAIVVLRMVRAAGLPGRRIALATTLAFPSLVLWSALALKDTYSLFFSLIAIWGVMEYARTRDARWFAVTVSGLLALESVRAFLFVILVVTWPLALAIALSGRRWRPVATAAAISAVLLIVTPALNYLDPNVVTASTYIRRAMAQRAGSSFVVPLPILRAAPCTRFEVTVPGRTPGPGPHRELEVPPGTELVVETAGASYPLDAVLVQPGDVVAVAGATPCPTPTASPIPQPTEPGATPRAAVALPAVVVAPQGRNVVSTPPPSGGDGFRFGNDLMETIVHLPVGAAAFLAAPFPPLARSLSELAATPEMLAWYALIVTAAVGLVQTSPVQRRRLAHPLLVAGAVSLVLILYEGNLGTLIRHRAMVIPLLILLAAPGLEHLWRGRGRRP